MKIALQDRNKWHYWFAWHPVECGNAIHWLEHVERRWNDEIGSTGDFSGHSFPVGGWEYRQKVMV